MAQPTFRIVRLQDLSLHRKESFKLVVALHEDEPGDEPDKGLEHTVRFKGGNGKVKKEGEQRGFRWQRISVLVGMLLSGVLIAALIFRPTRPADPAFDCAAGQAQIEGSSAFIPIIGAVATEYTNACPGAEIGTRPTGSIDGIRTLLNLPPEEAAKRAVLTDGKAPGAGALVSQPVAVVVYSVVVNTAVGIDQLTVDQIKGIHSGRYTDWAQLRPGPGLPIRIVSRGQESGTRQIFEKQVLGTLEMSRSSDSCERRDLSAQAPTIRCERATTAQVIEEISATPGAIGYADAPAAGRATAKNRSLAVVRIDQRYPDINNIPQGYPFWTVEFLYTRDVPETATVLKKFIDYLTSSAARAELGDAGYTPCIGKNGLRQELCIG